MSWWGQTKIRFRPVAALDQIAQQERRADHQDARRGHETGQHRDETRTIGNAGRTDVTDKPVGRRDCQDVEQDKDHLRAPLATIVLSRVGLSGHLSRPPGLHGGVR